jgi:endo-1,4-beta-xylanase
LASSPRPTVKRFRSAAPPFLASKRHQNSNQLQTQWQFVEPELGVFNFTEGQTVTDLARKNGQLLRCHNLVWHSQLAPWVEAATWDRENMTAMLKEHITREASEWKGQCYAWDVLNEALNEDGSWRETVFYNVLGPDYVVLAFETAAKADPHARLYYNDYNIEGPGPKSTAVVEKIVKPLLKAGIKNLGVGLQGHFVVGSTPSIDEQIATLESYTGLGAEAAYTEVDIRMDLPVNDTKLEQQKEDYKSTVGACMQVKKCVGITVWDFYDPVRDAIEDSSEKKG